MAMVAYSLVRRLVAAGVAIICRCTYAWKWAKVLEVLYNAADYMVVSGVKERRKVGGKAKEGIK